MITHRSITLWSAAIVVCYTSMAQTTETQRCAYTSLRFEASVQRETILTAEPAILKFSLRNLGNVPCLGQAALTISDGSVALYRRALDGTSDVVAPLSGVPRFSRSPARDILIKAGQAHEGLEMLSLGVESLFPERGTYIVTAALRNNDGDELFSAPFLITVVDPVRPVDVAAREYLASNGGIKALMGGEISPSEFVRAYGGSTYEPYARFAFGEWLFYRRQLALAEDQFVKTGIDFPLAMQALRFRVQIKAELGEIGAAEDLLSILRAKAPAQNVESITAQRSVIRARSRKELMGEDIR